MNTDYVVFVMHRNMSKCASTSKKSGDVKIRPEGYEDQKGKVRNKALIHDNFYERIYLPGSSGDPTRLAHDEDRYTYEDLFDIEEYLYFLIFVSLGSNKIHTTRLLAWAGTCFGRIFTSPQKTSKPVISSS
ncbi:hypothetical protein R1flu_026905 [Riccia fluitans]|uniref:Uncharacterized protein n=1 Tax=Riccia fluitans TaxID=41844 RepID=A0ABD1XH95_9MARC